MSDSSGVGEQVTALSTSPDAPRTRPPTDKRHAHDLAAYILQQYEYATSGKGGRLTFHVTQKVWSSLEPVLLRDYKLSCDYFPRAQRLVVRMHSQKHENFILKLGSRITAQLGVIASESGPAGDFAKDIEAVGQATIRPKNPGYGTHDPDASYRHLGSPLPAVVIEVAYAQRGCTLRALAEDYIFGSLLKIRVVVGFDISYRKKRATFSVWRPVQNPDNKVWTVEATVANRVFRHDNGEPNDQEGLGLTLRLEDFADARTCQDFGAMGREIFVSCGELYQYLERAETTLDDVESTTSEQGSPLKMHHQAITPEEQLTESDEEAFVEDEERVSVRLERDDASYEGNSPD
ncbi:hypothetical protein H2204_001258 [Knufia peltigerae]|uniref:Uncharacterized protein n=1 Tax=Knufia peltigerae TaxID=1002370 RepID=A0AA38YDF3_9EURO|nr:hypothetical protein H2204_001258 [Knufia peltigerae]